MEEKENNYKVKIKRETGRKEEGRKEMIKGWNINE